MNNKKENPGVGDQGCVKGALDGCAPDDFF